jgi:integrase
MLLTKANIATISLPAGKKDIIVFDDDINGFGLRVREGGRKCWIVQYRLGMKQRRLNLGPIARLSAEDARKTAKNVLARVTLGQDPQSDRQTAKSRAVDTLGVLVEEYLDARQSILRPRSYLEVQRHLRKHWKPLHELATHNIKRADVAARLKVIAKLHGPVTADRTRASLSAMFNWAIRDGKVETNPVFGTNKYAGQLQRDRVLTDGELFEIWQACPDDDYGHIVQLLMHIPARRGEIADMRWSELDAINKRWRLPAQRSKNHRAVMTPLPDRIWDLVQALPNREGRDLIFGRCAGGYSGWSKSKGELNGRILARRKEVNPEAEMFEWRLHDLRRTCATRLAEMGTQPHIIEELLNHVSGHKAGVAGVYNRATYEPEKRAALRMWADHLSILVSGQTIKAAA